MTSFFKRLNLKGKKQADEQKTIPIISKSEKKPEVELLDATQQATPVVLQEKEIIEPQQMQAGCGQSVGLQRDHNEDALFTLTTNLASDTRQIPFGLYIVADGMGGHMHGEIASAVAIRSLANHVVRKLYLPLLQQTFEPPDMSIQEILKEGTHGAHQEIMKAALGGGTTMTSALIMGDQMTIAHVGDSRAYLFYPDGRLELLTRDHSVVKRLEELGQITAEEASVHPNRNMLYRALGQGELFDPDIFQTQVPSGAVLMLCSDGLWGQVTEEQLKEVLRSPETPDLACSRLVSMANQAGGPDNITVIIVRMPQ